MLGAFETHRAACRAATEYVTEDVDYEAHHALTGDEYFAVIATLRGALQLYATTDRVELSDDDLREALEEANDAVERALDARAAAVLGDTDIDGRGDGGQTNDDADQ